MLKRFCVVPETLPMIWEWLSISSYSNGHICRRWNSTTRWTMRASWRCRCCTEKKIALEFWVYFNAYVVFLKKVPIILDFVAEWISDHDGATSCHCFAKIVVINYSYIATGHVCPTGKMLIWHSNKYNWSRLVFE